MLRSTANNFMVLSARHVTIADELKSTRLSRQVDVCETSTLVDKPKEETVHPWSQGSHSALHKSRDRHLQVGFPKIEKPKMVHDSVTCIFKGWQYYNVLYILVVYLTKRKHVFLPYTQTSNICYRTDSESDESVGSLAMNICRLSPQTDPERNESIDSSFHRFKWKAMKSNFGKTLS